MSAQARKVCCVCQFKLRVRRNNDITQSHTVCETAFAELEFNSEIITIRWRFDSFKIEECSVEFSFLNFCQSVDVIHLKRTSMPFSRVGEGIADLDQQRANDDCVYIFAVLFLFSALLIGG